MPEITFMNVVACFVFGIVFGAGFGLGMRITSK